tara:strand:- start:176 stop:403 length:228 start_codon:yes stop_codon:yes gene_type:complete
MSKPVNVSVKLGGKIRTVEQLIRKFTRACKDERIVEEWKQSQIYETKGQKRRRKKAAGIARAKHRAKDQKRRKRR